MADIDIDMDRTLDDRINRRRYCSNCEKQGHLFRTCTDVRAPHFDLPGCPACDTGAHNFCSEGCTFEQKESREEQWKWAVMYRNNTFPLQTTLDIQSLKREFNVAKGKTADYGPWTLQESSNLRAEAGRAPWGNRNPRPGQDGADNANQNGRGFRNGPGNRNAHGNGYGQGPNYQPNMRNLGPYNFGQNGSFPFNFRPDPQGAIAALMQQNHLLMDAISSGNVQGTNFDVPVGGFYPNQQQRGHFNGNQHHGNVGPLVRQRHRNHNDQGGDRNRTKRPRFQDEQQIRTLQATNTEKDGIIATRDASIATKDATIRAKDVEIASKNARIEELENSVQYWRNWCTNLQNVKGMLLKKISEGQVMRTFLSQKSLSEGKKYLEKVFASSQNLGPFESKFDKKPTLDFPVLKIPKEMPDHYLFESGCNRCCESHDIDVNCQCFCGLDSECHAPGRCPETCWCDNDAMHTFEAHVGRCNLPHALGAVVHFAQWCDFCHVCGAAHESQDCTLFSSDEYKSCICGEFHFWEACEASCPTCKKSRCRDHCFQCGRPSTIHQSYQCILAEDETGNKRLDNYSNKIFICYMCNGEYIKGGSCLCMDKNGILRPGIQQSMHRPVEPLKVIPRR